MVSYSTCEPWHSWTRTRDRERKAFSSFRHLRRQHRGSRQRGARVFQETICCEPPCSKASHGA
eukprot:3358900-Pyramimonas_sp.AAC.1